MSEPKGLLSINSMPRWAGTPAWKWCLSRVISVTVSATAVQFGRRVAAGQHHMHVRMALLAQTPAAPASSGSQP
jgi:hypothetical protein